MKRITLFILTLAIVAGTFAPVTVSLTLPHSPSLGTTEAKAQTTPDQTKVLQTNAGILQNVTPSFVGNLLDASANAVLYQKAHKEENLVGDNIGKCGIIFGTFSNCIVWIFYYIPYAVSGWLMKESAVIFDSMAAITLSSTFYSGVSFLTDGWGIIRDFSNIFFIIILLMAALSLILGIELGHANPKKLIASVVLIAIVINFSFFITEAVIDMSNALGLVFYNQIVVTTKSKDGTVTQQTGDSNSISVALVQAFQPAVLQSGDFWTALKAENNGKVPPFVMIGILVLVGCMYAVVAYSFFVASLSFIGRLATLWLSIIFSPFAFVSYIVPSLHKLEGFGWSSWWSKLIEVAFAAPIYFFFLFLISLMSKSHLVTSGFIKDHGTSATLIVVFISLSVFVYLMLTATKYVKKASGELGNIVVKAGLGAAAFVGGAALGALSGGTSFALRNTVGFAGKSIAENKDRKALAAGEVNDKMRNATNIFGKRLFSPNATDDEIKKSLYFRQAQARAKQTLLFGRKTAASSFDLRQNAAAGKLSEVSGMNFGGPSILGLSTKQSAGGYEGGTARRSKKIKDFQESLGYNHEAQQNLLDNIEQREVDIKKLENDMSTDRLIRDAGRRVGATEEEKRLGLEADARMREIQANLNRMNSGAKADELKVYTKEDVEAAIREGVVNRVTGQLFSKKDIGTAKGTGEIDPRTGREVPNARFYQAADVINKTKKADGTFVEEKDVNRTVRMENVGLGGLKKAQETQMKALANSYAHFRMLNAGYDVHGMKTDALGNIKTLGHFGPSGEATADSLRRFGRSMRKSLGSAAMGAAVGTAIAGPLGAAVGALGGSIGQVIKDIVRPDYRIRGQEAAAISLATDTHHQIHEFTTKYKSPTSGIFSMFKGLFSGGGGGGHGGGDHGHSQGGGGGHGGGGGGHH